MLVEQRDRGRLAARQLVVRVVAHDRAVRDRRVEALLRGAEAAVEPQRHVGDVLVQRLELALQVRGVGDEVAFLVAEHDALVGAQRAHPPPQDDPDDESGERENDRGERDDPGGARQVRHARGG